jgi:hypothetical protein
MDTLVASQERTEGFPFEQLTWETVAQWSAVCQRFLDWQRRAILDIEPSPEALAQHRNALRWLLRFARAIYLTASDPDYPDHRIAEELKGRLHQLEHSWRMVHDQMPDAEAEKLLAEFFPG